ncbi:MAG: LEPR-XLL domain-containing protein, partial [Oceanicola sp.]|nr:LEPR-XLL domain-containing protein [Oceanicola sp.]
MSTDTTSAALSFCLRSISPTSDNDRASSCDDARAQLTQTSKPVMQSGHLPPVELETLEDRILLSADFAPVLTQLDAPHEREAWTFTLEERQQIIFDLIEAPTLAELTLVGPDGVLRDGRLSNWPEAQPLSLEAGDYRLEFKGSSQTGTLQFALRNVDDAPVSADRTFAGQLDDASAVAVHSVDLAAGETLFLDVDEALDDDAARVWLYDSAGQNLGISDFEDGFLGTAKQAGRYTVLLEGRGEAGEALDYSFALRAPTVASSQALTVGGTVNGDAPPEGAVHEITLDMAADTPGLFRVQGTGSAVLLGPDDVPLWSGALSQLDIYQRTDDPALVLPAGANRLQIWGQSNTWSVQLVDVSAPIVLTSDVASSFDVSDAMATFVGQIEVAELQTVSLSASSGVRTFLLAPDGIVRSAPWMPEPGAAGTVTIIGYYTRTPTADSQSVTVSLQDADALSIDIGIDQSVRVNRNQSAVIDVTVTEPGLYVLSPGRLDGAVFVSPDGQVVVASDAWSEDDPVVRALTPGTWQIVVPPPSFNRTVQVNVLPASSIEAATTEGLNLGRNGFAAARLPSATVPQTFAFENARTVQFFEAATGAVFDLPDTPNQRLPANLPELFAVSMDPISYRSDFRAVVSEIVQTEVALDITAGNGSAAGRVAGRNGQALLLDDVGIVLEAPLPENGPRVVEAWLRFEDGARGVLAELGGVQISVNNGRITATAWDGDLGATLSDFSTRTADQWYHVAVRVDDTGRASLFVDGAHRGTNTLRNLSSRPVGSGFGIGVAGAVDDVRFWSSALDSAAIAGLAGDTLTLPDDQTALVLDLDFEGAEAAIARIGTDPVLRPRLSRVPVLDDPVGGAGLEVLHRFSLDAATTLWAEAIGDWDNDDEIVFTRDDGVEVRLEIADGAGAAALGAGSWYAVIEAEDARRFALRRAQDLPELPLGQSVPATWDIGRLFRTELAAGASLQVDLSSNAFGLEVFDANGTIVQKNLDRWIAVRAGTHVVRLPEGSVGADVRARVGARPKTIMQEDDAGILRGQTAFAGDLAVHVLALDVAQTVLIDPISSGQLKLIGPDGTEQSLSPSSSHVMTLGAGAWELQWANGTSAAMRVFMLDEVARLEMNQYSTLTPAPEGRFVRLALEPGQIAQFFDGTREETPQTVWRLDAGGRVLERLSSASDPADTSGDVIAWLREGTGDRLAPIPARSARPPAPVIEADIMAGDIITRTPGTDGTVQLDRVVVGSEGWVALDVIESDQLLKVRLTDPDGTVVHEGDWNAFRNSSFSDAPGPWFAAQGTWTIETWQSSGSSAASVSYVFRDTVTETLLGAVMQGQVPDEGHGAALHVIDVSARAVVRPEWVRPGGAPAFSGTVTVLGPDGSEIWAGNGNTQSEIVVLPKAGQYVVRFDGAYNADPARNPGVDLYGLQLTDLTGATDIGATTIDFTAPGWLFETQSVRGTAGRLATDGTNTFYRLAGLADASAENWLLPGQAFEGRLAQHDVALDWRAGPAVTGAVGGTFILAWLPGEAAGPAGPVPERLLADQGNAPRSSGRLTLEIHPSLRRLEVTHLKERAGSSSVDIRSQNFDIPPTLADLSSEDFQRLNVSLAANGNGAIMTVTLDGQTLIDGHALPGFVLEDFRLGFGARTSTTTANHDIDSIEVTRTPLVAAPLGLGDTVLSQPGNNGFSRWTIDLAEPKTLFLDRISGSASYYIKMHGAPDRTAQQLDPVSTSTVYGDPNPPALELAAGRWELIATTRSYGTSDHSFRLVDLSVLPEVALGSSTAVALDPGARAAGVSVTLAEGQRFGVEVLSGKLTRNASVVVVGPQGDVLARVAGKMEIPLVTAAAAGRYTVLWDRSDGTTTPHDLTAVIHDLTPTGGPLAFNAATDGPPVVPGATSRHSFTLTAPGLLHMDTLAGGDEQTWRVVEATTGAIWAESGAGGANDLPHPLIALPTGDWALEITRSARTGDQMRFVLADLAAAPVLTPDVARRTEAPVPGGALRAAVDLAAGDQIAIDGFNQSNARWWFADAAGQILSSGTGAANARRIEIAAAGRYFLVVDSAGGVDAADLRVSRTPAPVSAPLGERVEMAFVAADQVRQLTFEVTGDAKQVVIDTVQAGVRAEARLLSPEGTVRAEWDLDASSSGSSEEQPLWLGEGTWTVEITARAASSFNPAPVAGSVALRVLDVAEVPVFSDDVALAGRLDPGSLAEVFAFEGVAGQAVSFTFEQAERDARLFLWAPSGERVALISAGGGSSEIILPDTGRYLAVLRGDAEAFGQTRDYVLVPHLDLLEPDSPVPVVNRGDGPNLSVRDIALPSPALTGEPLEITWRSVNIGTQSALGALSERVDLLNSAGTVIASKTLSLDLSAAPLAAGTGRARSATLDLPLGAEGALTIRVTTDASSALAEANLAGTAEDDNMASLETVAAVPSFPNLVIDALTGPDFTAWRAGEDVTVSWTVRNAGDAEAQGPWTERVSLVDRATNTVVASASVVVQEDLAAGSTAVRAAQITVPADDISAFEMTLSLDTANVLDERQAGLDAEADNTDLTQFVAAPDLTVSTVGLLSELRMGAPVTVEWQTRNVGTLDAGAYEDRFELAYRHDRFNPIFVQTVSRAGLAAGESQREEITFDLPLGTDLREMRLRVVTNVGTPAVPEVRLGSSIRDADNDRALDRVPLPALRADLAVSLVASPAAVTVGDTIDVSWRVDNIGPVETALATWYDEVWLSRDGALGDIDDVLLARVARQGGLVQAAGYDGQATFAMPQVAGGDWQIIVRTDADATLDEPGTRANNASAGSAVAVTAPSADLSVESVTSSRTRLFAGETLDVTWRTVNAGPDPVAAGALDRILVSASGTLADAIVLAEIPTQSGLAAGEGVTRTRTLVLPPDLTGTLTLFVIANADGRVGEGPGGADNNRADASESISIAARPAADLVISDVVRPDGVTAGVPFDLSFTVTNAGAVAALGPWFDDVVLRDAASGAVVTTLSRLRRDASLAPGESYRVEARITPSRNLPSGNFLLAVVSDSGDVVFEAGLEANNRADGTPLPSGAPDLSVTVATPDTATAGDTVEIAWTLTNLGTRPAFGAFVDKIWLTPTGNPTDGVLLGEVVTDGGGLEPGQSVTLRRTVALPPDMAGPMQILVQANADASMAELAGAPATATSDITITALAQPDLEVVSVIAPQLVFGAEVSFDVSWEVTNSGAGVGTDVAYRDVVRLVEEGTGRTVPLGSVSRAAPPPPGQSYTASARYTVQNLSGDWRVEVIANAEGALYEEGSGANLGSTEIGFAARPFADLAVTRVDVAETATGGDTISVGWRVENIGVEAAPLDPGGRVAVVDRIEIRRVSDGALLTSVLSDRLLQLAPGGAVERVETVDLPAFADGDYEVIVITDSRGDVYEHTALNNNRASAALQVTGQPAPNLAVEDFVIEATAEEGAVVDFSWNVRSTGPGVADGTWRVSLIDVATGRTLWSAVDADRLAPGEAQERRETIKLPDGLVGTREMQLRITTSTRLSTTAVYERPDATGDNTALALIDIALRPRPDLRVTSIDAADSATAGDRITVRFEVINGGLGIADGGAWTDRVFWSPTANPSNVSLFATPVPSGAALATGESYVSEVELEIPESAGGTGYIIVWADANRAVDEGTGGELANFRAHAIDVTALPAPDLAVSDVRGPRQLVAGGSTTVSWTVTNLGPEATPDGEWVEQVWLTRDRNRPGSGDILLETRLRRGEALGPLGGYETSANVTLPETLDSGIWYLTPFVDPLDRVREVTFSGDVNPDDPAERDGNNFKASAPIDVIGAPEPVIDLAVVSARAEQVDGTRAWRLTTIVENVGEVDLPAGTWAGSWRLAESPTLIGQSYGTVGFTGTDLAPGARATFTDIVELGPHADGSYIVANAGVIPRYFAGVEDVDVTNNRAFGLWQVTETRADLSVTDVTVTPSALVGDTIDIVYTVTNVSDQPIWPGTDYVTDEVWITPDFPLPDNVQRAEPIALQRQPLDGVLDPGQSYTRTLTYTLPPMLTGEYHVSVITNRSGVFFPDYPAYEYRLDAADRDLSSALAPTYAGRVYEPWSANNIGSAAVQVGIAEADLVITRVEAPDVVQAGENIQVTVEITNEGARATRVNTWSDLLALSFDSTLDEADIALSSSPRGAPERYERPGEPRVLEPGESYVATFDVYIPHEASGDLSLLAIADAGHLGVDHRGEGFLPLTRGIGAAASLRFVGPAVDGVPLDEVR